MEPNRLEENKVLYNFDAFDEVSNRFKRIIKRYLMEYKVLAVKMNIRLANGEYHGLIEFLRDGTPDDPKEDEEISKVNNALLDEFEGESFALNICFSSDLPYELFAKDVTAESSLLRPEDFMHIL